MIGDKKEKFTNIVQAGNQAFFQSGDFWVQSTISEEKPDLEVKAYSAAFFQLAQIDNIGRYLALGENVRFMIGSKVVQVSDSGKSFLTDEDMRMLFPPRG